MLGYFLIPAAISAAVILIGLTIFVIACVAIAYRDSENAADIIAAMGDSFPLKGFWSRRK